MEKLFAIFALTGILIGVVSTAVIYLLSPKQVVAPTQNQGELELTDEQINQLREITSGSSSGKTNSGNLEETLTGVQENIQSGTISSTGFIE